MILNHIRIGVLVVLMILIQTSCTRVENIDYNIIYQEVLGYDNVNYPLPDDILLLISTRDKEEFYEQYITPRKLHVEQVDSSKAILYLQFAGTKFESNSYKINSIVQDDNELVINVSTNESSVIKISPAEGFTGKFYWVLMVELESDILGDNIEVVIITE